MRKEKILEILENAKDGNGAVPMRLVRTAFDKLPEPCEDAVPRASVEYICQKNTVSTNPYEHKYHDKFIQFMDDPEISDFGRWQHSNGFNMALVAVKCDLDKVPSAQPDESKYEYHYDHTDCIWYRPEARNRCPVTCAQYRDGWNDAMNYIFRDGKGYRPYRRDKQYGK